MNFLASNIYHSELEKRSALGAALFEAGAKWNAIGYIGNSLVVQVSFDEKSSWANGIFENSRSAKLIVHDDNRQLVHLTGWRVSKLRSRKIKDYAHLHAVLVQWVRDNLNNPKA